MTMRVLSRSFSPAERAIALGAYEDFVTHYRADAAAAARAAGGGRIDSRSGSRAVAELAALTMVANQIFSLDEALNK